VFDPLEITKIFSNIYKHFSCVTASLNCEILSENMSLAERKLPPAQVEQFQFGEWNLKTVKSHILKSEGPDRER